jgi:SNF family Na+-dependent transporter
MEVVLFVGERANCGLISALRRIMVWNAAVPRASTREWARRLRWLQCSSLPLVVKVALEPIGLEFFSIGVGLAVMITYAAYAGPEIDLLEVAVATIVGDLAGQGRTAW